MNDQVSSAIRYFNTTSVTYRADDLFKVNKHKNKLIKMFTGLLLKLEPSPP